MAKAKQYQLHYSQATDFQNIEGKGVKAVVDGQNAFVGSAKLMTTYQMADDLKIEMTRLK